MKKVVRSSVQRMLEDSQLFDVFFITKNELHLIRATHTHLFYLFRNMKTVSHNSPLTWQSNFQWPVLDSFSLSLAALQLPPHHSASSVRLLTFPFSEGNSCVAPVLPNNSPAEMNSNVFICCHLIDLLHNFLQCRPSDYMLISREASCENKQSYSAARLKDT